MILFDKDINFQTINNLEEIKNKWIEVFAGHLTERERIDEIYMDNLLWHVFSYEKIDCLEGTKARKAFDELKNKEYYIFFEDYIYDCYLLEYKDKYFEVLDCDKIKAKYFNKEKDIYIVDKYFRWTYVNTHESYCGPYFCRL
jgi:hypothetical protein